MPIQPYNAPYGDSEMGEYINQQIDERIRGTSEETNRDVGLFENQDMVKVIRTYLEENVPEELRQSQVYRRFWAILGKKLQLTFISEEDMDEFEAVFIQAKMLFLMSKASYKTNMQDLEDLKQLEMYYNAAIRSAKGSKENVFNERVILGSSINQTIRSNTEMGGLGGKKGGIAGFFSRFF